jgi:PhnB protein
VVVAATRPTHLNTRFTRTAVAHRSRVEATIEEEMTMQSRLNPYLGFKNNAREAMTFYQTVFGGELDVSTFADLNGAMDKSEEDLVMHSQLEAPNGMVLMGSDTPDRMEYKPGTNYSISLSGDDESELRGFWDKLADGGTVTMPLEKAPWGDSFGMLTDRYGVAWMVNISGQQSS